MKMNMIGESKWKTFITKFPDAYLFLLDASLEAEYRMLKESGHLSAREIERLTELEILKTYRAQLVNAN